MKPALTRRLGTIALLTVLSWLFFVYPWKRIYAWAGHAAMLGPALEAVMWMLPVLLFYLWIRLRTPAAAWLGLVSMNWLGVCALFMLVVFVLEIPALILPASRPSLAWLAVAAGSGLCLYASYNAGRIKVKNVALYSGKLSNPVRAVQLSDIHLGSRSPGFLERVVDSVNRIAPDVVFITGDLLDMSSTSAAEIGRLADLRPPVYFVTGNHDQYVRQARHLKALESAGVTVLENTVASLGEIQIVGVPDNGDKNHLARVLPGIDIDPSRYTVLLYHRPDNWGYVCRSGVDLMLSGHTHAGQIFPFDLVTRRHYPNLGGLYSRGRAHLYVSAGTGTWGPAMRLGSMNEITVFELGPDSRS